MPPSNPTATATRNPIAVVMKVCQALMRIGSRHCHPDAKIADGAGRMNCSIPKARTTSSQSAKMPTMTTHGRMWRSVLRRSRYGLRGRAGGASSRMSVVTTKRSSRQVAVDRAALMCSRSSWTSATE